MRSEHKKRKELTDFYMWMVENEYDHNIRIRVENKAELYLRELNRKVTTDNGNCMRSSRLERTEVSN